MNAPRPSRLAATITTAALLLLSAGCSNLTPEKTTDYYHPLTSAALPPKPKDSDIPILATPPTRKYEVIGRFTMRERFCPIEDGQVFMNCAAQYNARQAGADAIIVVERYQDRVHHRYVAQEVGTDDCGYPTYAEGDPDYNVSGYVSLDAKMIVYK